MKSEKTKRTLKWLAALLAAVLLITVVLAAAGCGKASDPADAEEDDWLQALEDSITASYMGAMENGEGEDEGTCYFAFTEDMAILVFVDPAVENSASFVGPYEDNDNVLTITDDESGKSITFEYQEQGDGYLLAIEPLDSYGAVGPVDASKVIAALKSFDAETNAVDLNDADDDEDADAADADADDDALAVLEASITAAYMGAVEDADGNEDGTCYFAFAGDLAIAVMVDPEGVNSISFVGEYADNGDGTLTIADSESGESILVGVEEAEDFEGYYLEFPEYESYATVIPTDAATVTAVLAVIELGTNAVA